MLLLIFSINAKLWKALNKFELNSLVRQISSRTLASFPPSLRGSLRRILYTPQVCLGVFCWFITALTDGALSVWWCSSESWTVPHRTSWFRGIKLSIIAPSILVFGNARVMESKTINERAERLFNRAWTHNLCTREIMCFNRYVINQRQTRAGCKFL